MTIDEKIKVIERTEKRYGPLMIMLRWNQYGVNQAHWISIKKGHVLDGQLKPKPKAVPLTGELRRHDIHRKNILCCKETLDRICMVNNL